MDFILTKDGTGNGAQGSSHAIRRAFPVTANSGRAVSYITGIAHLKPNVNFFTGLTFKAD